MLTTRSRRKEKTPIIVSTTKKMTEEERIQLLKKTREKCAMYDRDETSLRYNSSQYNSSQYVT